MATKSDQLQIRISSEQKRRLKQLARDAGMDLSAWVLSRVLPAEAERFQQFVASVAATESGGLKLMLRGGAGVEVSRRRAADFKALSSL